MAINFPSSPTLNQTFSANNVTYTWDGTKWNASTGFVSFSLSDKIQEGDTYTEVVDNGASNSYETVVIDGVERVRVKSSGQVSFSGSGSAAAPTLAIANDSSGIYSPASSRIAISTNSTGRLFINENGNVSIGTTASGYGLRVVGGVFCENASINISDGYGVAWGNTYWTGSNNGDLIATTNASEKLRIGSNGRVGIGVVSAGSFLDTRGFTSYRGNAYTIATFAANNTLAPLNIVQSTNGTHPGISAGQTSAGVYGPLQLLTSETVRMQITSNGYVGINELEPFGIITISGAEPSIAFKETDAAADNQRWYFRPSAGEFFFQAFNDANGGGGNLFSFARSGAQINQIRGYSGGSQWFVIDNPTRRLGINTTAPGHELDVAASSPVGTTAGNFQNVANIKAGAGANNSQIIFSHERRGNGTDWQTVAGRMRRWVDLTPMAYIDLGSGEGNFDRGQDIVFGNYDGEAVRIRKTGCIGVRNIGSDSIGIWVQGSMLASGETTGYSFATNQTVPNTATLWLAYNSYLSTVNSATAYTTNIIHFNASTAPLGTNCNVSDNIGVNFYSGSLVHGNNNTGFKFGNQDIPAGKNVWALLLSQNAGNGNRWNVYADGTAPNYFAGRVGIGDAAPGTKLSVVAAPINNVADGISLYTTGTGKNLSLYTTNAVYDYNGIKANEHFIYSGGANLGILADGYDFKICTGTSEKYRFTSDGTRVYRQEAPIVKSATATLTIAELKNGIIQYTGGALVGLTLPTGTLVEGGFTNHYDNMTFEWTVLNSGGSSINIGNSTGHSIVGDIAVPTNRAVRFATRRTAANTYVTYRIAG